MALSDYKGGVIPRINVALDLLCAYWYITDTHLVHMDWAGPFFSLTVRATPSCGEKAGKSYDTVYYSTVKETPHDTWWYYVLFYSKGNTTWHMVILCTILQ